MGPVELATTSFGQRFEISPLQLVTAVSAICNDGQLVKPKIVGKIENTDTGSIDIVETENIRQVISKDTADKVKNMMLSVVMEGTGKRARIDGYSIGGKSGTSEPRANHEEEGYVASFIGISPIENTQVVVLVALKGLSAGVEHQGGAVSGPIVHDILAEVLPYLGVANSLSTDAQLNQPADNEDILVALPNVKDMTLADATKKLQELGFNVITNTNQDPSTILVTDQLPKYGINLTQDSVVCLYTSVDIDRKKVTVPNIKDMTAAQAKNALKSKNLNINVEGTNGIVVSQDPTYETEVDEGTVVNVVIQEKLVDAH
jgi:stage V sporulation protein D (sporulation-specific penicillin-binding protein)